MENLDNQYETAIDTHKLSLILEALLMAADKPLSLEQLQTLLEEEGAPSRDELRAALAALKEIYAERAVELVEISSGYRFQTRTSYSQWVSRLWEEKPQKYSRALLETLALIAYRQPITRGDIEEIRGVSVSSAIIKTLMERHWVRVVGHREVPGRPAIYATTRQFLDYFNLKSLEQLPPLAEIRDLDIISKELSEQLEFEVQDDSDGSELPSPQEAQPGSVADEEVNEVDSEESTSTVNSEILH